MKVNVSRARRRNSSSALRHVRCAADEGFVAVLPRPAIPRRANVARTARWAARSVAAVAGASALMLAPAQAGALVTEVGSATVGLTPRNSESIIIGLTRVEEDGASFFNESPETFGNELGHPVVHGAQVFALYWDPIDPETHTPYYHGDWQNVIDGFFHNAGSQGGAFNSVFSVEGQYTDTSNKPASTSFTFRGAYTDTTPYPTASNCTDPRPLYERKQHKIKPLACLTDAQVRGELESFTEAHKLPTGMSTIYHVLTPPGVTVCLDEAGTHCSDFSSTIKEQEAKEVGGSRFARIYESESYKNSFCSYHSDINPDPEAAETGDAKTILYAVVPWTAGGVGDGQLSGADQREEYLCQDGGFDPSAKVAGEKEETPAFTYPPGGESEFNGLSKEGKEAWLRSLEPEGSRVEEPNQVPCPSTDGYCDRGLADLIINQIAVEQENTVTNPLLNAWQDSSQHEAGDECRNWFPPVLGGSSSVEKEGESKAGSLFNQSLGNGSYYLNSGFNLAAGKLNYPGIFCVTGIRLDPKFTAPNPVNAEETIAFDGMESDVTLDAGTAFDKEGKEEPNYAQFTWNFGDGTPTVTGYAPGAPVCEAPAKLPCAASVFHAYQYGGTYEATLTVTDVAGNVQTSEPQLITVVGPAPPSEVEGKKEGGEGTKEGTKEATKASGSGGGGGAGTVTPPGATVVHTPVISESALSKSLRKVLRAGLKVRYSVSEQVAGRFEVLLPTSVARHLGLHGPAASGLPAGTAPQTNIAKSIIVTTRGGSGTVTIHFGAKTAARLRKLHKVSFLVRLRVRSATGGTASALATVTLG
jgi:hypothetical protein